MEPKTTNLERLVKFVEDEGPELIPIFLSVLEMCFQSKEHSGKELEIPIGQILSGVEDSGSTQQISKQG